MPGILFRCSKPEVDARATMSCCIFPILQHYGMLYKGVVRSSIVMAWGIVYSGGRCVRLDMQADEVRMAVILH